jgi:HSP20 family protein
MMTLWRPFGLDSSLRGLDREVERLFQDKSFAHRARPEAPAEVFENEESITLRVDLPGVSQSDVQVGIENNVLTIKASRAAPPDDGRTVYHLAERGYGEVTRTFRLPGRVAGESAEARYEDGVLSIRFPKRAEAKARTIEVKGRTPQGGASS